MAYTRQDVAEDVGTLRLGRVLLAIDARIEAYTLKTGVRLQDLRLVSPAQTGGGWKVVLRGWGEDGKRFVAFHDAETFEGCMTGVEAKLRTVGFQWYEDVPYADRVAGEKLRKADVG
jgi:hypothetical protein